MGGFRRKTGLSSLIFLVFLSLSSGTPVYPNTDRIPNTDSRAQASLEPLDNASVRKTTRQEIKNEFVNTNATGRPTERKTTEGIIPTEGFKTQRTGATEGFKTHVVVATGIVTDSFTPRVVETERKPEEKGTTPVEIIYSTFKEDILTKAKPSEVDANTDTKAPSVETTPLSPRIILPDPIDNYANQVHIYSPGLYGLPDQFVDMIYSALTSEPYFSPIDTLNVLPVDTTYDSNENGDKLTSFTYVVSHQGQFVHSETITTIMSKPEVMKHFHKHLETQGLKEYQIDPISTKTSWIHDHLVSVVVPTCVAFLIVLLIVIFSIKSRSVNTKSGNKKNPKVVAPGREKCGPPPAYEEVSYGINNPTYDWESEGNARP